MERQPLGKKGLIISADTIVLLKDRLLEKPTGQDDACRMLKALSGQTHNVITSVAINEYGEAERKSRSKIFSVRTEVSFKQLSPFEIESYVATGEPMDKAGSYGIQGLGTYMIRKINGSWSNVVGLPLTEVADTLTSHFQIRIPGKP